MINKILSIKNYTTLHYTKLHYTDTIIYCLPGVYCDIIRRELGTPPLPESHLQLFLTTQKKKSTNKVKNALRKNWNKSKNNRLTDIEEDKDMKNNWDFKTHSFLKGTNKKAIIGQHSDWPNFQLPLSFSHLCLDYALLVFLGPLQVFWPSSEIQR